jgi:hypothetical protein
MVSPFFDLVSSWRIVAGDGLGQSTSVIKLHSQSTLAFECLGADSHKDGHL